MNRIGMTAALIVLLGASSRHSQTTDTTGPGFVSSELQPPPEIEKLLDAFAGNWTVSETFEVSASRQGKTRQGTASFRIGPGFSLVEDYRSIDYSHAPTMMAADCAERPSGRARSW
jgi:hypothetical protein